MRPGCSFSFAAAHVAYDMKEGENLEPDSDVLKSGVELEKLVS